VRTVEGRGERTMMDESLSVIWQRVVGSGGWEVEVRSGEISSRGVL
jgi:hypothetical protein